MYWKIAFHESNYMNANAKTHNEYDCNPFRMCFISLKRIETSTSAWRIGNISHFSVLQLKPVKSEKAVPRVSVCLSPLCSCRTVGDWQRNAPSPCRQHGCPKRSWPPFSAVTTVRAASGPAEIMQTSNRKSCITLSWERGENLLSVCCVYVWVCGWAKSWVPISVPGIDTSTMICRKAVSHIRHRYSTKEF